MELKTCPFCGSYDTAIERDGGRSDSKGNFGNYWEVGCRFCGSSSASEFGVEAAVDAWNTRTKTVEE